MSGNVTDSSASLQQIVRENPNGRVIYAPEPRRAVTPSRLSSLEHEPVTPPYTPGTKISKVPQTDVSEDQEEEVSLEEPLLLFGDHESSDDDSSTVKPKSRVLRSRLPAASPTPSRSSNASLKTNILLLGNDLKRSQAQTVNSESPEWDCGAYVRALRAQIPPLEIEDSTKLPRIVDMMTLGIDYNTIEVLTNQDNKALNAAITALCQGCHIEETISRWTLDHIKTLERRSTNLEATINELLKRKDELLEDGLKKANTLLELQGSLLKSQQRIHEYENHLEVLKEMNSEVVRKHIEEANGLRRTIVEVQAQLLNVQGIINSMNEMHRKEIADLEADQAAADKFAGAKITELDDKLRDSRTRLKGQRVIHIFFHLLLIFLFLFALIREPISTPPRFHATVQKQYARFRSNEYLDRISTAKSSRKKPSATPRDLN
ncbi:hypothetical protein TWF106_006448 [Orbilia oligospora]|uniref:Uncharacterized protein n=1 Tax=Orbilia oligospora TaxID=2813651 RepID=A0A7C8V0T4_ORBOL|nr:hypothetical protein TWF106_006448 [Orbilia oligospora]